jgi:hypothetical protein
MSRSNKRLARKNRRNGDPSILVGPPYTTITGAAVGTPTTSALMTFSGVMNLSGATPKMTVTGASSLTFAQVSPSVIRVTTNSAATLAGVAYTVPTNAPEFRSPAGGFVTGKTGTF